MALLSQSQSDNIETLVARIKQQASEAQQGLVDSADSKSPSMFNKPKSRPESVTQTDIVNRTVSRLREKALVAMEEQKDIYLDKSFDIEALNPKKEEVDKESVTAGVTLLRESRSTNNVDTASIDAAIAEATDTPTTENAGLMTRPKGRPTTKDVAQLELNVPKDVSADKDFMASVKSTASNLNISEDDLLRVIQFETAGSWDPAQPSSTSNGVGLIQFMPKTAAGLGTTTEALAKMTRTQQMPFVEKHLKMFLTDPKKSYGFSDLYMAVHFPAAVGKSDDYVVYSSTHKYKSRRDAYAANTGMDVNQDGVVTKAEAVARAIGSV